MGCIGKIIEVLKNLIHFVPFEVVKPTIVSLTIYYIVCAILILHLQVEKDQTLWLGGFVFVWEGGGGGGGGVAAISWELYCLILELASFVLSGNKLGTCQSWLEVLSV